MLFGPERTGLDNDEVALADEIVTFPANPAYASLNLAQAVLLVGYEWFKAAHGDAPPPPAVARAVSPPANGEMTLAFFEFLEGKLDDAGFFRPVGKKPGMRRNLRNMFHRMAMTQQDVRTLWGAVVRLVEGPRVEVQTRKRVRPKAAGKYGRLRTQLFSVPGGGVPEVVHPNRDGYPRDGASFSAPFQRKRPSGGAFDRKAALALCGRQSAWRAKPIAIG